MATAMTTESTRLEGPPTTGQTPYSLPLPQPLYTNSQHYEISSTSTSLPSGLHASANYPLPSGIVDYPFNSRDVPAANIPIAEYIDRRLQNDPGYDALHPNIDLISYIPPPPRVTYQKAASQKISARTLQILFPSPPSANETPLYQYYPHNSLDSANQTGPGIPVEAVQGERGVINSFGAEDKPEPKLPLLNASASDDGLPAIHRISEANKICGRPSPPDNSSASRIPTELKHNKIPCTECCLAATQCHSIPGQPCTRCTRLLFDARDAPTILQSIQTSVEGSPCFISWVVFSDMEIVQTVLSDLRYESEQLTMLHPETLEHLFDGAIICHMASISNTGPSDYVSGAVDVVINRLATTRLAASEAKSSNSKFPAPGLNAAQMDGFLNLSDRVQKLDSLRTREKDLIIVSLQLSDYIAMLFNWNGNRVCFQEDNRGFSLPQAKNIVLETPYFIAWRINELFKILLFEVNRSFKNIKDKDQDPGTILCALWIVYSSIKVFKELDWDAKSLQNLKRFLNGLKERAGAAMAAIERCRREMAWLSCVELSPKRLLFKGLVKDPKVAKRAVMFTYEKFRPDSLLFLLPHFSCEMSYTDVLEAHVPDSKYLSTHPFTPNSGNDNTETLGVPGKIVLANLRKRDGTSQSPSRAVSVSVISQEDVSVVSESPEETDDSPPSLTRTASTNNESLSGLAAQLEITKDMVNCLKQNMRALRKGQNTELANIHEDWVGQMPSVGPSREIELAQLDKKAQHRISGAVQKRKRRFSNAKTAQPALPSAVGPFPDPFTQITSSAKRARAGGVVALVAELDGISGI